MFFRIMPLLFLLVAGCTGNSDPAVQDNNAEFPAIEIPFEKHVLPNGLTLILHEDHKAPLVAVNVWYHVGSKDEKPGKTGFAHVFEHLMFQGSENFNDEFFRPLEKAGATGFNGTTNNDRTNYFENVPKSTLDTVLWLESDRMGHLLGVIDQARLDEQRGVVQNEKRQRENTPYGKIWEHLPVASYPAGHPYSWSVIGSLDDLNAASLTDVHEWFRKYYGAANAVLVVAGDIVPADVIKRVEHYFGNIPAGPVLAQQKSWVAPLTAPKRMSLQDRVPQARIYKVWNVAPLTEQRTAAQLDLAAAVLGAGKNSRLYTRLVYRDQIATDVTAFFNDGEIGSQIMVFATAKPGEPLKKVEQALDEEIALFLREGPNAEELARVKTAKYAALARGLERIGGFSGKTDLLAHSEVYFDDPGAYRVEQRELRDAKPDAVRDAARQWLTPNHLALEVHPYPEYKVSGIEAERKGLPDAGAPPPLDLPDLQRATLSNGLKIVLAERHAAPLVQFNLLVNGGYAADDPALPGLADFTLSMLTNGTQTRDALEISARADALGATLDTNVTNDYFRVNLSALTPKLDDSLELFSDVIRNPAFADAEIDRLRALRLAEIQRDKVTPGGLQSRNLARLVYGPEHPYAIARGGDGTEAAVKSLTAGHLRTFATRWLRPDNATLVVTGDTSLAALVPKLERHLKAWRAAQTAPPQINLPTVALPAKPRVYLINRTDAEQTQITAGQLAPPRKDAQHVPMMMVNAMLGGMIVSRTNMNLREEKHWSYGSYSYLPDVIGQRLLTVWAPVQRDKTAESIVELQKEMRGVTGVRPFTATEIAAAKDALVLKLPGNNESTPELAASINNIVSFGLPDDFFDTLVGNVRAQSPAMIAAAAARLVQPDAVTWLVIGDLARIEGPVRKLNIGEVTVLDADGNKLR